MSPRTTNILYYYIKGAPRGIYLWTSLDPYLAQIAMALTLWFVGEYMRYVQTSKIHTDARFAIKPARTFPISPDFHRRETYTASRGVKPIDARPGDSIVIR